MSIWKDSNGGLHDDMDGAALALPCWPAGMTKLSDGEAAAIAAGTDAAKWSAYQESAKRALEDTSTTVERIVEAVALGKTSLTAQDVVTFMEYRAALRAILNELQPKTIPTDLPLKPTYPAST